MKTKKLIAALAALVTVFALAGCSLSREVASLDPYSPSDGVQVDLPELKARNVLFVSDAEGNSVLIGSFLNTTDATLVAQLETMDSNGEVVFTDITIPAEGKFDLGYNGTEGKRLFLTELPGSMHPVYIRAGGDPTEMLVPILDGTLEEYRPFID
ncbi:unannotated protein [freshwater metagenome]|uniref:Unannotated protein n=1 Tax=freshwater metagenome TaxID=449393 RepID=A0A6J6DGV7_9ZZZZ|nr:hypothetical protein [Actinomycetota bacterium]